ncbi:aspartyl-phosphate phosphatase Spo0E family protein [Paenibacillus guangzhouensis]|uniref:aspartyl-phosphate phosphatase Spo0E family protein n=1 Tax=Paenibacillus guangzhouensis TaxID=1473112 RepID=UPI001D0F62CF|nr:aspartyl-phosphate phosphatase Spo0E family protein [Paenibacillus guangzhouensis]
MYSVEYDLRDKARDSYSSAITLEDEIQFLRLKMEEIVLLEKSFTSDIVIQISSLLDVKINEYMRIRPRKS